MHYPLRRLSFLALALSLNFLIAACSDDDGSLPAAPMGWQQGDIPSPAEGEIA